MKDNMQNVVDYNKFIECKEHLRNNYPSDVCVPGIAFCRELMHKTIENDDEIPLSFTVSHLFSTPNSHDAIRIVMQYMTNHSVNSVEFYAHGKKSDYILCECHKEWLFNS